MTSKTIALALVGFGLVFAGLAKPVNADNCSSQYGCQSGKLQITKEVQNPITGNFVKSLSTTDAVFSPGAEVLFELSIKNTSGETLNPVTVQDVFPEFLSFEAGPGTYDQASKTLTFELDNLIAGESRTAQILAKVDSAATFPVGRSFFCVVNEAKAGAPGASAEDTAQLCIETQVLGATTLPVAGTNDWMLILPFLALGGIGFALAKRGQ